MRKLRLKIGQRIVGIVILLIAILTLCIALGLYKMKLVGKELNEVVKEDLPFVKIITEITTHQLEQSVWVERTLRFGEILPEKERAKFLLKKAEEEVKKHAQKVEEELKKAYALVEKGEKETTTSEQKEAFKEAKERLRNIETQYKEYYEVVLELFSELHQGNIQHVEALAKKAEKEAEDIDRAIALFEEQAEKFLDESLISADRHETQAIEFLFVLGILGIVFGFLTGGALTKDIVSKLRRLTERLKDLATGEADLTKELPVKKIMCSEERKCGNSQCLCYGKEAYCWYEAGSFAPEVLCERIKKGEISSCEECFVYKKALDTELEEVATFVNAFIRRLRGLIIKAKQKGEEVAREAYKLSAVSEDLASGAVEAQAQAEGVNKTATNTSESISAVAAAMEEMSATIQDISQQVTRASEVAQSAANEAEKAQRVINNLADASVKINEVSQIIGDIAEQIKLLALNASIEAARAGEAGKGFAVVANEVKELAQQTGRSVVEIENIIKTLQKGVEETLNVMNNFHEVIKQVAEFSHTIAAAIEEQTITTGEINENTQKVRSEMGDLVRMNETITAVGTQTAQGAEHVKNTAKRLNTLSEELKLLLNQFKT